MWLSERLTEDKGLHNMRGTLEHADGQYYFNSGKIERVAGFAAPYGYSAVPPTGCNTAAVSADGEFLCIGAVTEAPSAEDGEIVIKSAGGAFIKLMNDGTVSLNGLIIKPDGSIKNV